MAINRPRHILPESLDVLFDGRGLVIETYVGRPGLANENGVGWRLWRMM